MNEDQQTSHDGLSSTQPAAPQPDSPEKGSNPASREQLPVAAPRRRWLDIAAAVALIMCGVRLMYTLVVFCIWYGMWDPWSRMISFLLGATILWLLAGIVAAVVRLVRRRTSFRPILLPVAVGILFVIGIGVISGDVGKAVAWLFVWPF